MRVCRIVSLLQLPLLLLLLGRSSGASNIRQTQITSPWNIKGVVPKSHVEQPNSSAENSWGRDNSKLSLEACIRIRNGRYVVCPTFQQRESHKQGARTKPRQSGNDYGVVKSKDASRKWLRRAYSQLGGSKTRFDSQWPTRRFKKHVLYHHANSDEWIYEPQGYVVYDVSVPLVISQWTIPSEYIQEMYDIFSEANLDGYYEEGDYVDKSEISSDNKKPREEFLEDKDEQVSTRMGSLQGIPKLKKPKDAPLSHMLQHIYPPYPMIKTANKRY